MTQLNYVFSNIMSDSYHLRSKLGLEIAFLIELSVYAAMVDISRLDERQEITIEALRTHTLLTNIPKPSLYRAITNLQDAGRCTHIGTVRSGKIFASRLIGCIIKPCRKMRAKRGRQPHRGRCFVANILA